MDDVLIITGDGLQRGDKTLVLGDSLKPLILTGNTIEKGDVSVTLPSSTLDITGAGVSSSVSQSSLQVFPNDNLFNDPTVHFEIPVGHVISGVKPPVTTDLTATTKSSTRVDLQWGTVQFVQISGYKIERMKHNSQHTENWGTVITVNPESTTYNDTGLSAGTFSYRVSAVNSVGDGETSNVATATTVYPPDQPTSLTSTTVSGTRVDLSWTAPAWDGGSPVEGYKIERSYDGLSWSALVENTGDSATSYSNTGLTNNVLYYYRVSAINILSAGEPSGSTSSRTWKPPSNPTGLVASTASDTQINLTWSAPAVNGGAAVSGYQIERVAVSNLTEKWLTIVANTESTETSYASRGLSNGTLYYYRVSAISSVGTGQASEEAFTTTWTVPGRPTGLTATTVSGTQINLDWMAPGFNGGTDIRGYKIERSPTNNNNWSTIVTNTQSTLTTYESSSLTNGTLYYYRVSAVNSVGTGFPSENETSARTWTVPSLPTISSILASAPGTIKMVWTTPVSNDGPGISGYKIERSSLINQVKVWSTIVANTNSTYYVNSGLQNATLYYYRVSAINGIGTGLPSPDVSVTTWPVPTEVTAVATSTSSIQLNWTVVTVPDFNITGYKIERSIGGDLFWETIVEDSASRTYINNGLIQGKGYFYRVSAVSTVGTSSASSATYAMTWTTPSIPYGVTATATSTSSIRIDWTAPVSNDGTGILGYKIDRSSPDNSNWQTIVGDTQSTTTSYENTGLTQGVVYYYRVSAINSLGVGNTSVEAFTTPWTLPSKPTGLKTTIYPDDFETYQNYLKFSTIPPSRNSNIIVVDWDYPSIIESGGMGINNWQLELSVGNDWSWKPLELRTMNFQQKPRRNMWYQLPTYELDYNYRGVDIISGTRYYYRVTAINGLGYGPKSDVISVVTWAVPDKPTSVYASGNSLTSALVTWDVSMGGTYYFGTYDVYAYLVTDTTISSSPVASINVLDTWAIIDGLTTGDQYAFKVRANNFIGSGLPSDPTPFLRIGTSVPKPPLNVSATHLPSGTGATVSWTVPRSTGGVPISSYKVYAYLSSDLQNAVDTKTLVAQELKMEFPQLTVGSTYVFKVTATNSVGEGEFSLPSSELLMANPPGQPTTLTATITAYNQIKLDWVGASVNGGPPISYKVLMSVDNFATTTAVWTTDSTSYTATGLIYNGILYYFRVAAYNVAATGAESNTASATTLSHPTRFYDYTRWRLNENFAYRSNAAKEIVLKTGGTDWMTGEIGIYVEYFDTDIGWRNSIGWKVDGAWPSLQRALLSLKLRDDIVYNMDMTLWEGTGGMLKFSQIGGGLSDGTGFQDGTYYRVPYL